MSHLDDVQLQSLTLFFLAFAVKPTVIDVGIYINSIGPVSSIDMVSLGIHLLPLSPYSHTHIFPLSDIRIITHQCSHYSCRIFGSRGTPQLFPHWGKTGVDVLFTFRRSTQIKRCKIHFCNESFHYQVQQQCLCGKQENLFPAWA